MSPKRISKTELALRIEKERNLHKMEKRHRWIEVGRKYKLEDYFKMTIVWISLQYLTTRSVSYIYFAGYWKLSVTTSTYRWADGIGCPTRYRTRDFFNNFTVSQQLGALHTHTLKTHSSSFLTQRTYSCSNFVATSSLVLELLKKCRVR